MLINFREYIKPRPRVMDIELWISPGLARTRLSGSARDSSELILCMMKSALSLIKGLVI
jgi:hypothetical protein